MTDKAKIARLEQMVKTLAYITIQIAEDSKDIDRCEQILEHLRSINYFEDTIQD